MASPLRRVLAKKKIVACTHCGDWIEVGRKAMSVFCPHCKKRVVIEDYKINAYHAARKVYTTGDVTVGKNGTLSGDIKASNLTVRGNAWGSMEIRGKVQLTKTAQIRGDVFAPRLVVESGATIQGHFEIGRMRIDPPPLQIDSLEKPAPTPKPNSAKTSKRDQSAT